MLSTIDQKTMNCQAPERELSAAHPEGAVHPQPDPHLRRAHSHHHQPRPTARHLLRQDHINVQGVRFPLSHNHWMKNVLEII
jgi:hypothetical protein